MSGRMNACDCHDDNHLSTNRANDNGPRCGRKSHPGAMGFRESGTGPAPLAEDRQPRMIASTSSRRFSISSGVVPSRFSRSSGSVLEARTLKCQSSNSTEMPSSS